MNEVPGDATTDPATGSATGSAIGSAFDLAAVLTALLRAAEATKAEETAVRRAAALRIAELEKARVRAYRRHHLIQLIGSAAAGAADREAALAGQTAALAARLDWGEGATPEQREVIAALEPVMSGVADAAGVPAHPPGAPAVEAATPDGAAEPADLVATLETFERWFAARFEDDFFRVFERHTPEARGTDF